MAAHEQPESKVHGLTLRTLRLKELLSRDDLNGFELSERNAILDAEGVPDPFEARRLLGVRIEEA